MFHIGDSDVFNSSRWPAPFGRAQRSYARKTTRVHTYLYCLSTRLRLFVHARTGYVRDVVEPCEDVEHEQDHQGEAWRCTHIVFLLCRDVRRGNLAFLPSLLLPPTPFCPRCGPKQGIVGEPAALLRTTNRFGGVFCTNLSSFDVPQRLRELILGGGAALWGHLRRRLPYLEAIC